MRLRASRSASVSISCGTKSLYAKDRDGIEFEVVWLIPHEMLTDADRDARSRIGPLDLDAEIARFGPDTVGATSVPA